MGKGSLVPLLRNIESAITAAKFQDIRFTVVAGTDNISIGPGIFLGKPAGTAHIAIALPVRNESADKKHGRVQVPVKEITFRFMYLLQLLVQVVFSHRPVPALP